MIRRLVPVALAVVVITPIAAFGQEDVESMMETTMDADFHGSGVVMSSWGDDEAATTYEVTRSDGMSMVAGPGGTAIAHDGMMASLSGADWYALEVSEWSAWSMADRYSLGTPVATERLGRPATEIMVMEGARPRVRIVVDDASTVPLLTEVFDASGGVFRMSALVEFDAAVAEAPAMPEEFMETDMMMPVESPEAMPGEVFGYTHTDTYGMDASSQSFYSDGLFSFSVFEAGRGAAPSDFTTATSFEVDGARYRRIVTADHVWVQWATPEHSYVLVGDLPPDHIEAVLAEMPQPGTRGAVMRLIARLFG